MHLALVSSLTFVSRFVNPILKVARCSKIHTVCLLSCVDCVTSSITWTTNTQQSCLTAAAYRCLVLFSFAKVPSSYFLKILLCLYLQSTRLSSNTSSTVNGLVFWPWTHSQIRKLKLLQPGHVSYSQHIRPEENGTGNKISVGVKTMPIVVDAGLYLWDGDMQKLSSDPCDLD